MVAKMPVSTASWKILDLARADGWFALYDPSNPEFRKLLDGRVVSISDALGNLPVAQAETVNEQPVWELTAFNGMGAARYGEQSVMTLSAKEAFNQPIFVMILAQFSAAPGGVLDDRPQVFAYQVGRDAESLSLADLPSGSDDGSGDVCIGPVLLYRGVPSDSVRGRMTRLLTAFASEPGQIRVDRLVSSAAVLMNARGELEFEKDPDRLEIPASLTKMLTAYLVRQVIGDDRLGEKVTLTDDDRLTGSEPALQVGDQLTYRDLLYLAMLPSHNVSAELLASRTGLELAGTGGGREKFIAKMNATVGEWGWHGAEFTNASGLGTSNRATARQIGELLWRIAKEDPVLLKIMGARTRSIDIAGPNPRTVKAVHTIGAKKSQRFREFIAGKTGTLRAHGGSVAMLVDANGERKVIVTMGAQPSKKRYSDSRMVLDGTAEYTVSRTPEIIDIENKLDQILENADSPIRQRIADIRDTQGISGPVAVEIPKADLSALGSRIVVTRSGNVVELLVGAVKVPGNVSVSRAIPKGFRPIAFAFGSVTVRDEDSVRMVEIRAGSNGQLSFFGNQSSDTLRGTFQWMTAEPPLE